MALITLIMALIELIMALIELLMALRLITFSRDWTFSQEYH